MILRSGVTSEDKQGIRPFDMSFVGPGARFAPFVSVQQKLRLSFPSATLPFLALPDPSRDPTHRLLNNHPEHDARGQRQRKPGENVLRLKLGEAKVS